MSQNISLNAIVYTINVIFAINILVNNMETNITISSDGVVGYDNDHSYNQSPTVSIVVSKGCVINSIETGKGDLKQYVTYAISKGDSFMKLITGETENKVIDLLFTAVNNRTIERNFFKKYCDLLDGTISENEFEGFMQNEEKEYIVDESITPDLETMELALCLIKKIKNVDTVNDLSSLFSFNPDALDNLIHKINGDANK